MHFVMRHLLVLIIFLLIGCGGSESLINTKSSDTEEQAPSPVVTIWYIENDGDSLTLPVRAGFSYNFTVDWGDGSSDVITSAADPEITHIYATSGDKTVIIDGLAEAWSCGLGISGDCQDSLKEVADFGNPGWIDLEEAFSGAEALNSFSGGITSQVTNMKLMFNEVNCNNIHLSTFDTSSVKDMSRMFERSSITSLDLSSFNLSSVIDMSRMFNESSITSLNLSNLNAPSVTDMSRMFEVSDIASLDLSNLNASSVTDMSRMFSESNITSLDLSSLNAPSVTDMSGMFSESNITALDLSNFNTSSVTNMSGMFFGSEFTALDLSSFNTSSVTDMSGMFSESNITALDLSNFNTSSVTNMSGMFNDSSDLISLNATNWDIVSVSGFTDIFNGVNVGFSVICDQGGSPATGTLFGETCN